MNSRNSCPNRFGQHPMERRMFENEGGIERKCLSMLNLKKTILVGGMTAVIALTGCEMMNNHSGDRTAGRALDDKTITATVQHDLNRAPVYKFDGVDVKTYDGVVQL